MNSQEKVHKNLPNKKFKKNTEIGLEYQKKYTIYQKTPELMKIYKKNYFEETFETKCFYQLI